EQATGGAPLAVAIDLVDRLHRVGAGGAVLDADTESGDGCADLARRLAALAEPGLLLLTRTAFDRARPDADGDLIQLCWLAHGSYEIDGRDQPVEVCEVGRAGAAPLRPPDDSAAARRQKTQVVAAGWRPAPGLALPERPHWLIRDKLGEGGFGEVWRAEHAKTGESRVFKFCYDAGRLRALRREITLFRLLKNSLGDRRDIVRIYDWRFDQAPYYVESAYTAGGSLRQWVASRGGADQLALELRVELVAQIADAVAAAHSVGVLHKDIKPDNILIRTDDDGPRAQLGDFGVGGVAERAELDRAGITALGFTEATATGRADGAGTRLYAAPEVVEGKAATMQGDVYAVGVILYQMVVGDLGRALAPGWERDIADELLREDIAAAVDGAPDRRLRDVADLARRLRSLSDRRAARAAARAARERAADERARQTRARRRRLVIASALAALTAFAGVLAVTTTVQSRRVAAESRRVAAEAAANRQISDFLIELLEGSDPYKARGREVTVREILDRGAARIAAGLDEQPVVKARLMRVMGVVYGNLGHFEQATELLEAARHAHRRAVSPDVQELATVAHTLGEIRLEHGELDSAEALLREAVAAREKQLGPDHPSTLASVTALATVHTYREQYDRAQTLYERVLAAQRAFPRSEVARAETKRRLGQMLSF
ncbi:MAG: tetratricopeptide repeat-containing protein kinase family protein, partial [Myxococcota bacterium]